MSTLLLITSAPTSIHAWHALGLAQALKSKNEDFRVFFYQDGVQVANDFQWVPDDQRNLTHEWQKLAIRLKSTRRCFFYAPCSRGKPASRAARVPPISTTYSREASKPSSFSAARGALLPPPHKI